MSQDGGKKLRKTNFLDVKSILTPFITATLSRSIQKLEKILTSIISKFKGMYNIPMQKTFKHHYTNKGKATD